MTLTFPPCAQKTAWLAKVEAKIKKTFYLQVDIQHHMYEAHKKEKDSRHRQIQMMRALSLNVVNDSEKEITLEAQWLSKCSKWTDDDEEARTSTAYRQ